MPDAPDTVETSSASRWLLLIHRLPPKPDYVRVKVRRRLERLGAVPVKNSVYVLPNRPETLEDFQWLAREIVADGGEASICTASFLVGTSDDDLVAAFRAARASDYDEIAEAAKGVGHATADVILTRLARRLTTVAEIDHFESPARGRAEAAIKAAQERLEGNTAREGRAASAATDAMDGRTWVTRAGVFVDRMASAWLIRRFIDNNAHFVFASGSSYKPRPGEIRFDMFDAEYTHEGDRCTFEVLLDRFGLHDTALTTLAEIVHDIDLKDEKFGRPETSGVAAVLGGIAATTNDDAARLEQGAALFDGLYATFGGSASASK